MMQYWIAIYSVLLLTHPYSEYPKSFVYYTLALTVILFLQPIQCMYDERKLFPCKQTQPVIE